MSQFVYLPVILLVTSVAQEPTSVSDEANLLGTELVGTWRWEPDPPPFTVRVPEQIVMGEDHMLPTHMLPKTTGYPIGGTSNWLQFAEDGNGKYCWFDEKTSDVTSAIGFRWLAMRDEEDSLVVTMVFDDKMMIRGTPTKPRLFVVKAVREEKSLRLSCISSYPPKFGGVKFGTYRRRVDGWIRIEQTR